MSLQLLYESKLQQYRRKTAALFHALRESIMSGKLAAGTRLPSTRALAEQYGLSRGTVNVVYDMLQAQGYVEARPGSGTVVAYAGGGGYAPVSSVQEEPGLSRWGERVNRLPLEQTGSTVVHETGNVHGIIDFSLGRVDLRHFPSQLWNRLLFSQIRGQYRDERRDAYAAAGHLPLREGIARHLRRTRGLDVQPEDVVMVSGSHQALALLVQLTVDPGDAVVVEDPGYTGVSRAITAAGGTVIPCPVDRNGLVTDALPAAARMVVVTPGRHFPTGAVMPMERRLALLRYAERTGCLVVEDDYDSEFRFRGRPIEPLKALDRSGRVVFIGTFSRTMMQDIRLGYAVLPPGLVTAFRKAKQLFEPHPVAIMEQRALAAFLNGGEYERHLRRMRRVYQRRSETFAALLQASLEPVFDVYPNDAGLHIYAEWTGSDEAFTRFLAACAALGVRVPDLRPAFIGAARPAAAFGFAHLAEDAMAEGVRRMAEAARLAASG